MRITFGNYLKLYIKSHRKSYRVFCFFDRNNRLIIINGFLKKSSNTPKKELQKAMRIRKEYFTNIVDPN